MLSFKGQVEKLLATADIKIGGDRPWDIRVLNDDLYRRVAFQGTLGLGDAYVDGWWECDALDQFFYRVLKAGLGSESKVGFTAFLNFLQARFLNLQNRKRAFQVGEEHYDAGNDLYKLMLDKRLVYTCGYWRDADNLDDAQEAKLDLVCRKIGLKESDHILDIGCGWGSFAKFAAEKYGASVDGITISKEQVALGNELCKGLPVDLKFMDYRDLDGQYDKIVSLGMFEHVGVKNYRTYFEAAEHSLKDDGLFLLHSIGFGESTETTDPWIAKYIFPNGMLPSVAYIGKAIEDLFIVEDLHNFGAYYDLTLMAWFNNFEKGWPQIKDRYSEKFYRMWKYYLLSCAGAFRARHLQLWQIVLSKKGVLGGYVRPC
jgi:cyclopropane-fatty-acyl-phospholipid synthase